MRVFAVPRSTPIAFAGKRLPALKKGQRINPGLGRPLRCRERAVRFRGRKLRKATERAYHQQGIVTARPTSPIACRLRHERWTCGTPTGGAKRRREERSQRWTCGTPTVGAKRRREERSQRRTCGTPTGGAKRRGRSDHAAPCRGDAAPSADLLQRNRLGVSPEPLDLVEVAQRR